MAAHVPRRRCVGCGRVASKPELVRLAAVATARGGRPTAALDRTGMMSGRGAYVCLDARQDAPSRDCMRLATRAGVLQRAFRGPVDVPAELVESES
ncbi:MAG TPA: YlxR family protein [Solirubrobacteraceae bacterium]|nr:YlxR family protein [Solirubrobacteraceae bacterium]